MNLMDHYRCSNRQRLREVESVSRETRFWHPYADMGSVRHSELVMERAEDVWVWDADGKRYLDATAGLWYANVGHGRPEIGAAVAAQMERMAAYSAFFDLANRPALELAGLLADRAPMPAKVLFGSGGSDGIDTAAKLARRYWWELGEPDRCLPRHARLRNCSRRYRQQPPGRRTAGRHDPGASRLDRGDGGDVRPGWS
jgi:adenosylmethionine-8-amino-7-oxononanoate aminotransferase